MIIEKEEFFQIIKNVSESEDLSENNLLERIKNELLKKDEGKYSTYNNLRIDKIFSVLVDSSKIVNYTLLHLAVECENAKVVKCLLQNGIKVDEPILELDGAKSGLTALHIAASHGHQEIVQLLLDDKRVNPLLKDAQDQTPREMVRNMLNRDVIIKMLEEGERRHATSQSEAIATRKQTYRSSNTLLQPNNKASKDYRNNKQTSLDSITNANKVDDILEREQALGEREAGAQQLQEAEQRLADNQKLIEQKCLHDQHLKQYTPHNGEQASLDLTTDEVSSNDSGIYTSVEEAHEELVEYLKEHKKNINEQDGDGLTLLHFAVEINYKELVELLIEHGANVDAQDKNKRTPLHFAVAENNEELVELLIEHRANVDAQNKDGLAPLHYAVAARNKELVKLLIEHKANIDVQDKDKRTPLYFAAKYGYVEIIECLVDSRASVNIQDKDGYTPLYFINKYIKIIKSLKLEQSETTYIRELENELKKSQENIAAVVNFQSQREGELNDKLNRLAQEKKDLESKVERLSREVDRLKGQQTNAQQKSYGTLKQLNDKNSQIQELEDSDEELKRVEKKLEKAQEDLERLKGFLTENETKQETLNELDKENKLLKQEIEDLKSENATLKGALEENKDQHPNYSVEHEAKQETFNKLDEENKLLKQKIGDLESENATFKGKLEEAESQHSNYIAEHEAKLEAFNKRDEENKLLKQEIEDLKSENATLKDELKENKDQHSRTNEVLLKKAEKKPPLSKIAYVSLVTTSMVGSILSIVSGLFVLSMIATSVTSALVAGGITYTMSKPTTGLKEVNIQSPGNNKACEI